MSSVINSSTLALKIILTVSVILFVVQADLQVETLYCHLDSEGVQRNMVYLHTTLRPRLQYNIYPHVRDGEDVNKAINCTWVFTVQTANASQRAAVALLELRRKEGGQVMAGDSIRNMTFSVTDNSTFKMFPFVTNMSRVLVNSGNTFTISLSMDNASAHKMDNSLFLRMFLVTGDSCPSGGEFQKFGHSCITVRNASYICGSSSQLDNCSLMTNLAIRITSTDELTELVQNVSSDKDFSRQSLSNPTIINGLLCNDGILMTCAGTADSSGHGCRWKPISRNLAGIAQECGATSGRQYVTLRVTGNGKPDLGLVNSERATQPQVLLAIATANDHAKEAPVQVVLSSALITGIVVVAVCAVVLIVGVIYVARSGLCIGQGREYVLAQVKPEKDTEF